MEDQQSGGVGAAGTPAGASHTLHAAAAASRLPATLPASPPLEVQQQEAKFQAARKAMIKVINWQVRRYWREAHVPRLQLVVHLNYPIDCPMAPRS